MLTSFSEAQGVSVRNLQVFGCTQRENTVSVGQRIFQRPKHERQRCAKLVADIGEELGLESVQFLQPLVEDAQLLGLTDYLFFGALALGDVPAFRKEIFDLSRFTPDRL